jgi:hypothetical protein
LFGRGPPSACHCVRNPSCGTLGFVQLLCVLRDTTRSPLQLSTRGPRRAKCASRAARKGLEERRVSGVGGWGGWCWSFERAGLGGGWLLVRATPPAPQRRAEPYLLQVPFRFHSGAEDPNPTPTDMFVLSLATSSLCAPRTRAAATSVPVRTSAGSMHFHTDATDQTCLGANQRRNADGAAELVWMGRLRCRSIEHPAAGEFG